ncbi:MAG: cobalt-zinc-cadmium efflux system outer membrane protein, partial [Pseudoalteromonas distincta]
KPLADESLRTRAQSTFDGYSMRVAIILAVSLAATAAQAAPLTYPAAVTMAEGSAPSLEASALQLRAAQAARHGAGRLPDPKLSFGVDNFPVSGPNGGRYSADFMTMTRLGVMQDVPNAARRRAEKAQASAEMGIAEADEAAQRRQVRTATARAWIDLAFAERKLATLDQLVEGLKALWEGQPAAVASGGSRPGAGLAPTRLKAQFADRRSELVADVAKARAELARWTGDPAPTIAGPLPDLTIDAAQLRAQLDDDPRLASLRAAARRADAASSGAKAAEWPDWSFSASYARRDPMFGDMVSLGGTVSLPLFKGSRQEPAIAARAAEAARARVLVEDARRQLVAALDADLAEHRARVEKLAQSREVLVPTAEQTAHLEVSSYAATRADYSTLVETFTALADAKLDEIERQAGVARLSASILMTYGNSDK